MTSKRNLSPLGDQIRANVERILSPQSWLNFPALVAVSGGPDSVALLRTLIEIGNQHSTGPKNLIVAHINHGTRFEASDRDESFVRELAVKFGLKSLVRRTKILNPDCSEEKLRLTRYRELSGIAHEVGARYILMGHTIDDQIETILFRILRGTGLEGLRGIPTIRLIDDSISVARPLLQTRRQLIQCWLQEIGQAYCIDETNRELRYSRNYLRHRLLPELRERFGESICDSILRLSEQAEENQHFLGEQTKPLWRAVKTGRDVEIDCRGLQDQPVILLRHLMIQIWKKQRWPRQAMTFSWWTKLADAVRDGADNLVLNLPSSLRFEKNAGTASIMDLRSVTPEVME